MEIYNGILAVSYAELTTEGVMSLSLYKKWAYEKRISVIRRGGSYLPALISWSSVPSRYKEKFIEVHGDPVELVPVIEKQRELVASQAAIEYFKDFTFDNGESLSADHQAEYIANSMVLDYLDREWTERRTRAKVQGLGRMVAGFKVDIFQVLTREVAAMQTTTGHKLPTNKARLQSKLREYQREGYRCLISKKFFNSNSEKLTDEAKLWLLAHWATPVSKCPSYPALMVEYNEYCKSIGAKAINSVRTIQRYLEQPDVRSLWQGSRMGYSEDKNRTKLSLSTLLPTMRDSIWYTDGTKLNLYYLNPEGKMATIQVYEVMDAYSETFLGYDIAPSESFECQYNAIRMALERAGHKPYQITFDNQSGLTSKQGQAFTQKIAHLAIRTQPYNGASKTIESAFGRFQQSIMSRQAGFTGLNITAVSERSRPNMEYIMANRHKLQSLEKTIEIYAKMREEWNNAPHPSTGISRLEMYESSVNTQSHKIGLSEMIDLFFEERKQPITYDIDGLVFTHNNVKLYYWMYNEDGTPNVAWHTSNIGRKFRVKQDPKDENRIALYSMDRRFVGMMMTKLVVHRGIQEQLPGERAVIIGMLNAYKQNQIERKEKMCAIMEQHGVLPEQHGYTTPNIPGVESSRSKSTIGKVQKAISNMDFAQVEVEMEIASGYDELVMNGDMSRYNDFL